MHVIVEPLYSGHPWEQNFGRYIGVAFIEGLFCTQIVHLGPWFLAIVYRGGFYSRVAVNRGSTVQSDKMR